MNHSASAGNRLAARALTVLAVASLFANGLLIPSASAQTKAGGTRAAASPSLTEEQRIVHVLNRLGFGARPGDVERVRRMGLEKYVEQQLNPSSVSDEAVEVKLRGFETLGLSNAELLAKYPNPGALIRQMQRRGELPPELAELVQERMQNQRAASGDAQMKKDEAGARVAQGQEGSNPEARMTPDAGPSMAAEGDDARRKYRRAIAEYMRENGLRPPQLIVQELQAARILRAVYSERQLQEVMVDFWTNHFNVFAQKGADRWFLTSYDRDVIRPHALGNFRELLEATAKSPAMLFYLDNFQSMTPNAQGGRGLMRRGGAEGENRARARRRGGLFGGVFGGAQDEQRRARREEMMRRRQGRAQDGAGEQAMRRPQQQRMRRGINENYARELMELHTLGVEGGYTQKDVQEVARAFTGWTIRDPRGFLNGGEGAGSFYFNSRMHDAGEKVVLGQKIPAAGGVEDGQKVLDILVRHPSTAKFVATKLARRFVSDEPPPSLVARAASAFEKSGGDIKATLRAIFDSPEFFSAEARRAKIKTPFEYAVSAVRTLGAEVDHRAGRRPAAAGGGASALHQWVARMGEPLYLYQAPTGYPDTAEHWVNTGALLERMNFALALAGNRIAGVRVDLNRFVGGEAASGRAPDRQRVVDRFLEVVLQGDLSPRSREVLMRQLSDPSNAADAATPEVTRIAALVVGSPEFQRQ
jgi:uncharacterized protein (DUF1800 family)